MLPACESLASSYYHIGAQPTSGTPSLRVLVIGGSGLQGAPIVRKLQEAGHDVTVCSRGTSKGAGTGGKRPILPEGVATLICDRNADGIVLKTAIVEGAFDVVVDYFAMKPSHVEDIISAFESPDSTLSHYIFI